MPMCDVICENGHQYETLARGNVSNAEKGLCEQCGAKLKVNWATLMPRCGDRQFTGKTRLSTQWCCNAHLVPGYRPRLGEQNKNLNDDGTVTFNSRSESQAWNRKLGQIAQEDQAAKTCRKAAKRLAEKLGVA